LRIEAQKLKEWRENPVTFVREVFKAEPDAWQADILNAFPTNKRVAMKASKGPGKSTTLAWLSWNFLLTRLHPKVAATSISGQNLQDGLWTEMAKWQSHSKLLQSLFVWTKTRIVSRESPEQWWMSARTWAQSADSSQQANTLAGLHADYLMFVLDEVGGIPDSVMAAAEAGLSTGIETKIIMAGNPTHVGEGPLYRACTTERHLWFIVEISGDPDNPKRSPRISVEWAREQIEKYGRDNPWVKINVFGEFPPTSVNSLLGPDEVTEAMNRHLTEDKFEFSQKRLGVDVARFGDDLTVIFPRQGLVAFKPMELRNSRTNEIAAAVAKMKSEWGSEVEFIDDTGGYGGGVVDSLLQGGISPIPVNFSGKSSDVRYFNARAEMWFRLADWVKRGGVLPNIPELVRELTIPTYTFHNGKMQIEPKDQIKERLGFSPDRADALAATFYFPDQPAAMSMPGIQSKNKKGFEDYDPFADERMG